MERHWLNTWFPFLSIQEGLSKFFFLFFFPQHWGVGVEDDIQGLVHAEQVCHQLSYNPSPVKLLKKKIIVIWRPVKPFLDISLL